MIKLSVLVVSFVVVIFITESLYLDNDISRTNLISYIPLFDKLNCTLDESKLLGNVAVESLPYEFNAFNLSMNASDFSVFINEISSGGSSEPPGCKSKESLALVIPYKNRFDNLNTFLYNMHPFLQRQQLKYTIFVVEQSNEQLFNKGVLMNAAFLEIVDKKSSVSSVLFRNKKFDCVLYHDVDLIPTGIIA
jgi:hypothetical protein